MVQHRDRGDRRPWATMPEAAADVQARRRRLRRRAGGARRLRSRRSPGRPARGPPARDRPRRADAYYADRYDLEVVGTVIPSFDTSAEVSSGEPRTTWPRTIRRRSARPGHLHGAVAPRRRRRDDRPPDRRRGGLRRRRPVRRLARCGGLGRRHLRWDDAPQHRHHRRAPRVTAPEVALRLADVAVSYGRTSALDGVHGEVEAGSARWRSSARTGPASPPCCGPCLGLVP
jgi:hypothetical protein